MSNLNRGNDEKNFDPDLENSISQVENGNTDSVSNTETGEPEYQPNFDEDREIPELNDREHSQGKKAIFWGIVFILFIVVFVGIAVFAKNFSAYRQQQKIEKAEQAEKNKDQTDFASDKIDADKSNFVTYPEPTMTENAAVDGQNPNDPNAPNYNAAASQPVADNNSTYVSPQPNYQQPNATPAAYSHSGGTTTTTAAAVETPNSRKMGSDMMYSGNTGKSAKNADSSGVSLASMQGQGFMPQGSGGAEMANTGNASSGNGNSRFGNQYQSTNFASTQASQRTNLSLLLKQGTMIPCVLKTKIVSTFAGQTSCQVTKDIYSANGKALLIERGSSVIGEQTVKVEQGQARVFVLWSKLDTPKGITLTLDSGAVDNLGASGMPAKIDNHWWKRFGSAILLSVIEDGLQALANQNNSDQSGGISYNSSSNATKEMAKTALENSINIPPTATINQGTLLNIFVARDVDFRGVYELAQK